MLDRQVVLPVQENKTTGELVKTEYAPRDRRENV